MAFEPAAVQELTTVVEENPDELSEVPDIPEVVPRLEGDLTDREQNQANQEEPVSHGLLDH